MVGIEDIVAAVEKAGYGAIRPTDEQDSVVSNSLRLYRTRIKQLKVV